MNADLWLQRLVRNSTSRTPSYMSKTGNRALALQAELKDAATRHAPSVELLPFARRVLELSSHAGSLPPAELQSSLMRLAIDAITQAEGAAPAAVATPASPAPARSQKPATTPTAPVTATPPLRERHEISVSSYATIRTNCIVPFSVERVRTNIYFCDLLF